MIEWRKLALIKNQQTPPPQQVSLLEKVIIQAKNANTLGVVTESLKVTDGKWINQKKTKDEYHVTSRESNL